MARSSKEVITTISRCRANTAISFVNCKCASRSSSYLVIYNGRYQSRSRVSENEKKADWNCPIILLGENGRFFKFEIGKCATATSMPSHVDCKVRIESPKKFLPIIERTFDFVDYTGSHYDMYLRELKVKQGEFFLGDTILWPVEFTHHKC